MEGVGARMAAYSDTTAWRLGDWLTVGQNKYGRRYKEAVALTGLEYQTLRTTRPSPATSTCPAGETT